MKKKLIFKVLISIIPSILMLVFIYLMRGGKDILEGLYIVFPLMYIGIGILSSSFFKEFIISILLTSIAFLIPINIFFNMGACFDLVLIYFILACSSYFIKKAIKNKLKKE